MMRMLADSIRISRLHAHLLRHTYATQFQIGVTQLGSESRGVERDSDG